MINDYNYSKEEIITFLESPVLKEEKGTISDYPKNFSKIKNLQPLIQALNRLDAEMAERGYQRIIQFTQNDKQLYAGLGNFLVKHLTNNKDSDWIKNQYGSKNRFIAKIIAPFLIGGVLLAAVDNADNITSKYAVNKFFVEKIRNNTFLFKVVAGYDNEHDKLGNVVSIYALYQKPKDKNKHAMVRLIPIKNLNDLF